MESPRLHDFVVRGILAILASTLSLSAAESEWKAGVAQDLITPEGPYWMGGYASRKKPSEGTKLDLRAKALALEDAKGERLIIVTLDLLVVTPEMSNAVLGGAKKRFGLDPANVIINCSHTHCGPELRLYRETLHNIPKPYVVKMHLYVDWVNTRILDLVEEAMGKLEPARLTCSESSAGFAINRRNNKEAEAAALRAAGNLQGPVDHAVPVLRVLSAEDKELAIVFGYACHNTTMGFFKTCGDYAGYAQKFVGEKHPGAVPMFIMGAGGDQNPSPRREERHLAKHGHALADAVEKALSGKQVEVESSLRVARKDAQLEFQPHADREALEKQTESKNQYQRWKANYVLGQLDKGEPVPNHYELPVQAARLGKQILLLAIGGESVVDYSLRFKKEFGASNPMLWFAGYSTDVSFYLPSLRVLREGGYEGGGHMVYTHFSGPFAENVEERTFDAIRSTVNQVLK